MPMTVAITGGTGYIGTAVCRLLAADPDVDRILLLDLRPPTEPLGDKVQFRETDVSQPMVGLLEGVAAAVHLAWVLNPTRDAARQTQINLAGTRTFLAACAAARVRRVLAA